VEKKVRVSQGGQCLRQVTGKKTASDIEETGEKEEGTEQKGGMMKSGCR